MNNLMKAPLLRVGAPAYLEVKVGREPGPPSNLVPPRGPMHDSSCISRQKVAGDVKRVGHKLWDLRREDRPGDEDTQPWARLQG